MGFDEIGMHGNLAAGQVDYFNPEQRLALSGRDEKYPDVLGSASVYPRARRSAGK